MTVTISLLCLIAAIVFAVIALLIALATISHGNADAWAIGSLIAFYASFLPVRS